MSLKIPAKQTPTQRTRPSRLWLRWHRRHGIPVIRQHTTLHTIHTHPVAVVACALHSVAVCPEPCGAKREINVSVAIGFDGTSA